MEENKTKCDTRNTTGSKEKQITAIVQYKIQAKVISFTETWLLEIFLHIPELDVRLRSAQGMPSAWWGSYKIPDTPKNKLVYTRNKIRTVMQWDAENCCLRDLSTFVKMVGATTKSI